MDYWIDVYRVNTQKNFGRFMMTFRLPAGAGFIMPRDTLEESAEVLEQWMPRENKYIRMVSVRSWAPSSMKYKIPVSEGELQQVIERYEWLPCTLRHNRVRGH